MADTRWEDIYNKLKAHKIEVYSPGQKTGECKRPYVVVKSAGRTGSTEVSSSQDLYDLMCYVPKDQYSTLEGFVNKVEEAMDELFPMIRSLHFRTASFYDDSVKGHMVSTQYVNWKKNTRR